jgi:hypothetical protein
MNSIEETREERIRTHRTGSEGKTVAEDTTKKDDPGPNLTIADLTQTDETETEERRKEIALPVRSGEPSAQMSSATTAPARARKHEEAAGPLFTPEEAKDFRSEWENVQVGFVDEPRRAVEQADHLVAEAIKRLAEVFADERQKLERQWDRGENVSTEDLRLALRRYRSFFQRLLAV